MAEVTKKAKGSKRSGKLEPIYEELAKKIKGYVPDYFPRLVKEVFPMEDAKIAMELPAPAEEIARKLHLD